VLLADVNAPVTAAILAALDPQPGSTVLDLAGGTGDLAEALAPLVGRVIATDLSPGMVDAARRRGIPNAEHRVLDMQSIDLPDASVDAVACRYGYMLVPDTALALRETRRVLRAGGRLAFSTWADAARNPWATAYGPALVERGLQEPTPRGSPGQFALAQPEAVAALVHGAGFDEVEVEEVSVEYRFRDWADYREVTTSLAASLRATLEPLDETQRAEIDEAARERLAGFRDGEGYVLPGLALVTAAR
jgi:SAM-dependent methyltransferase